MKHIPYGRSVRFFLVAALLFVLAGLAPTAALAQGNSSYAGLSNRDVAGASLTQPAMIVSNSFIYIVKPGDTLARIAARYHVTIHSLLVANPAIHNVNLIYIGQRLVIPTTTTAPTFSQVNIYLISMGTGNVGCGDQVVAVKRNITPTTAPLTAAINQLLAQHSQFYGQSGLYNALWQSNLALRSITRSGSTWNIYLTGTVRLGGVCDIPRVEAQLNSTARQFSTVSQANYFINGVPLKTALSQK